MAPDPAASPQSGPKAGLDSSSPSAPPSSPKPGSSELVRRVASGAVMALGCLALTYAGGWWFAALVAVGAGLMCWEWGHLVRGGPAPTQGAGASPLGGRHATADGATPDSATVVHTSAAVASVLLAALGRPGWGLGVLAVAGAALYIQDRRRPLTAFGVAYVGIPVLVLVWLRREADYGLAAVLYLFLAVWVTDIAAYAFGRTLGGPKLAPSISPGKTWSGLLGGIAMAGLTGAAFGAYVSGASPLRLGIMAVILAIAAQIGDLYESALKRRSGRKDASNLIPGHGGVLDRVDGLVAAVGVATILVLLTHIEAPARGLLTGL